MDGAPHRLDLVNGALVGCALSLSVSTLTVGVLRHRHTILDVNDDGAGSEESEVVAAVEEMVVEMVVEMVIEIIAAE